MKRPKQAKKQPRLVIDSAVLRAIQESIGDHPAERGGILGRGPDGVIRHFAPDRNAACSTTAYEPDVVSMNQQIKEWKAAGISFHGFVHSHPPFFRALSSADEQYAVRILAAFKSLDVLALPLVMTTPDTGTFEIIPFVAVPDAHDREQVSFLKAHLSVIDSQTLPSTRKPKANGSLRPRRLRVGSKKRTVKDSAPTEATPIQHFAQLRYYGNFPSIWRITASRLSGQQSIDQIFPPRSIRDQLLEHVVALDAEQLADEYFERVTSAYDLPRLDKTRLLVIGTGGAAGLIKDCARAGFGEFVLIDPDEVSASNIATQSVDPMDLGKPKTDALAKFIVTRNPRAAVVAVHGKIEDISDTDFRELATGPLRAEPLPAQNEFASFDRFHEQKNTRNSILLVLTDNFEAQARGHRLGLHFGISTICAQEYHEGLGAEITFTIPGVTPACHRCITASRYCAYLSEGYRNTVTSYGAPIFSAQMLNASLGFVLLAVAHHGTTHKKFGRIVERLADRNLILLRMDPDIDQFLGRPAFSGRQAGAAQPDAFFMMDSLFLKQSPDRGQSSNRPVCPDCGGLGDLRRCIGTFEDTRVMRSQSARG